MNFCFGMYMHGCRAFEHFLWRGEFLTEHNTYFYSFKDGSNYSSVGMGHGWYRVFSRSSFKSLQFYRD